MGVDNVEGHCQIQLVATYCPETTKPPERLLSEGFKKLTVHCGEADLMQRVSQALLASNADTVRPTEAGFKP